MCLLYLIIHLQPNMHVTFLNERLDQLLSISFSFAAASEDFGRSTWKFFQQL